MASSFVDQIKPIIHLIDKLRPKRILDIGKGFGKYGFLIHEYVGISYQQKIDPSKPMKDQSSIAIDAVEVDDDLMLPHLNLFYQNIYRGDILKMYEELPGYEMVLMIDIIEHIEKEGAISLLKYLLKKGSKIIISTPIDFYPQQAYQSDFETHISHWTVDDFKKLGYVEEQYLDSGGIYLLSNERIDIRGFGNSFIKKLRRIARAVKNEF